MLAYVLAASRTTEDLWGVTLSLAALAALTAASLWRCTRPWPVTDNEFLAQLMIDVLGWTVLMYFSGANNLRLLLYRAPGDRRGGAALAPHLADSRRLPAGLQRPALLLPAVSLSRPMRRWAMAKAPMCTSWACGFNFLSAPA